MALTTINGKNAWEADPARKWCHIILGENAEENEHLAMIREVAMVTNLSGEFAMLIDIRKVNWIPDYAGIVKLAREVWRLRSPKFDYIALLAPPAGHVYGKTRQTVMVLTSLGLMAELFTDEAEARRWLEERQPLVRGLKETSV